MELENLLDDISKITTQLATTITQKNRSGDYFINGLCEDVFITTFNKIFKCNFKNLNYTKPNAPAIDLFDDSPEKEIIIQVTSTNSPKKLYDTISKLVNNIDDYKDYKNLYLFVLKNKSTSYSQPEVDKRLAENQGITFNINENIIDIHDIPQLLRNEYSKGMSIQEIIEIKERLDQSVNGLDFKYKKLKAADKTSFAKTSFVLAEEKKLDREIVNTYNRKKSNIEDLFDDDSRKYAILKSNPGLGKSYSLYTYFNFLFAKAIVSPDNITPFILNFKDIKPHANFEEHIITHFHKRKNPLLIIDGLDEIGDTVQQGRIEKNLYEYLLEHANVRCLVSGRYDFITPRTEKYEKLKFEMYELAKLRQDQIEEYLVAKGIYQSMSEDPDYRLIKDALQIPFNLYNVSEYYAINKRLEKSIVFLNHKRINEDIMKHCSNNEMLLLNARLVLEKLSLINNMTENKVFSIREVAKLLKYNNDTFNSISKIKFLEFDKINETARFSNNQKFFEDILIAYFLKDKESDTILSLFSVGKNELNIPQTWYNALSMLLSLKGIDSDFAKKVIDDYSYILVNADDFGLSDAQKSEIFQKIFNLYEKKDIWIDNVKYEQSTLAKFGDNSLGFDFLIAKLQNPESNFRTKSKAIMLLAKFIPTQDRATILFNVLQKIIISGRKVGDGVSQSYHCLTTYSDYLTPAQKKNLIKLSSDSPDKYLKNNEYVRSAVYNFISSNNLEDDFIWYLLEGLKMLDYDKKGKIEGRKEVTLVDEGFYLDNAFFNIKNKQTLHTVIKELFNNFEAYDRYHGFSVFEKILETTKNIITKEKNNKVFIKGLINIFSEYNIKEDNWYYWKEVFSNFNLHNFIIETLKSEKEVVRNLINKKILASNFYMAVDVVANLTTANSLPEILLGIDKGLIKMEDAVYLFDFVNNRNPSVGKVFKRELLNRKATIIPLNKYPTKEEIEAFQKEKFDLLLSPSALLNDMLTFFSKGDEIVFDILGIPEWYDGKFFYNGDVRIEFLRKHFDYKTNKPISRDSVRVLFDDHTIQDTLFGIAFEKLKQFNYTLSEEQQQQLTAWLLSQVKKVDFRNAFTVHRDGVKINKQCMKLYEFKKILNIKFDKQTSLDLLSFYDINNRSYNRENRYDYFDNVVEEINDLGATMQRVKENLESGIKYSSILENHIMFSAKYNLKENFPLIEKIIEGLISEIQDVTLSDNPLIVYYSFSKNFAFLSRHIPTVPNGLFWSCIDCLISEKCHNTFVTSTLTNLYETTDNYSEKLKACNFLIKNNAEGALQKFLETITHIKRNNIYVDFSFHDFSFAMSNFKHVDIQSAIRLITLTYLHEFDNFDHPQNIMIGYFENLIRQDKKNYKQIKKSIEKLIKDNRDKLTNIQFLEVHIDRLQNILFSEYKSNYSFNKALEIIEKIDKI